MYLIEYFIVFNVEKNQRDIYYIISKLIYLHLYFVANYYIDTLMYSVLKVFTIHSMLRYTTFAFYFNKRSVTIC